MRLGTDSSADVSGSSMVRRGQAESRTLFPMGTIDCNINSSMLLPTAIRPLRDRRKHTPDWTEFAPLYFHIRGFPPLPKAGKGGAPTSGIIHENRRVGHPAIASRLVGEAVAEGATTGVRGGLGPVLKGAEGVERAIAEVESEGGRVVGREITVETSAGRARVDFAYEDSSGNLRLGEAKNGPYARLNPNQRRVYATLETEGGRLVGGNARAAGLPTDIGPASVRVFKY